MIEGFGLENNLLPLEVILVMASLNAGSMGKKHIKTVVSELIREFQGTEVIQRKLSGLEAASFRKYVDLSVGQYNRITYFLKNISQKTEHESKFFNIFPSYLRTVQKVDVEN